jgi:hypothetical protein
METKSIPQKKNENKMKILNIQKDAMHQDTKGILAMTKGILAMTMGILVMTKNQ